MKKLKKTDWTKVIKQLNDKGLTQDDISTKTGVGQGKISKLLHGADIYYDGGLALMKLLKKGK